MIQDIPFLFDETIHLICEDAFNALLQSWILRFEIAHRFTGHREIENEMNKKIEMNQKGKGGEPSP